MGYRFIIFSKIGPEVQATLRCTNIVFVSVTIAESRHIGRSERWMHPVHRFGGNNYPIKGLYDNDFFQGM